MAGRGHRTGILDLTHGEMGTRGTAADRAREAMEAAKILKVAWRRALDIPDGRAENTWQNRLKVARVIRQTRPRVVILPYWKGRHPNHYTSSMLGYERAPAGLSKLAPQAVLRNRRAVGELWLKSYVVATKQPATPATRPFKIIYATFYYDVALRLWWT